MRSKERKTQRYLEILKSFSFLTKFISIFLALLWISPLSSYFSLKKMIGDVEVKFSSLSIKISHYKKNPHFGVFNNMHFGGWNHRCGAIALPSTAVIQFVVNYILAVIANHCSIGQTTVLWNHEASERLRQPLKWKIQIFLS